MMLDQLNTYMQKKEESWPLPHTMSKKVHSRWILNLMWKIIKLSKVKRKKRKEKNSWPWGRQRVLKHSTNYKGKNWSLDNIQIKNSYSPKTPLAKSEATKGEKTIATHVSNKRLVYRICKECLQTSKKKAEYLTENKQNIWTAFLKRDKQAFLKTKQNIYENFLNY